MRVNPLAVIGRFGLVALAAISGALLTASAAGAQTPVFGATGDRRELFVPGAFIGTSPTDLTAEAFEARAAQYQQTLLEWSYGRLRVTADWHPWVSLGTTPTCDERATRSYFDQALVAEGLSLTPYHKLTYLTSTGCPAFSGMAGVGSRVAVLFGTTSAWEHEAGHRLGLYHSGVRQLENDGRYFLTEIGNPWDIMGAGRDMNGPSRVRLGWLPSSQVVDVTTAQEITLRRLEIVEATGVKLVRVSPLGPHENWQQAAAGPSLTGPFTTLFIELRTGQSTPWIVLHAAFASNNRWWHVGTVGLGSVQFAGVTIDVLDISADSARVRVTPLSSTPSLPRPPSNVRIS